MVKMRANPCEKCGWKYPGSHICVNLSEPMMKQVGPTATKRVRKKAESDDSEGGVSNMRLRDAQFRERNKQIVKLYAVEQKTMRDIAKQLLIDDSTVMNVLHAAKERGEITIRKTARRAVSK